MINVKDLLFISTILGEFVTWSRFSYCFRGEFLPVYGLARWKMQARVVLYGISGLMAFVCFIFLSIFGT